MYARGKGVVLLLRRYFLSKGRNYEFTQIAPFSLLCVHKLELVCWLIYFKFRVGMFVWAEVCVSWLRAFSPSSISYNAADLLTADLSS